MLRRCQYVLLMLSLTGWGTTGAGCGSGAPAGPPRYVLSGTVTFAGKPVPKGLIVLEPDASKGNEGPGGGAPIVDGKFTTPREQGIIGGAYTVRISGYDGVPADVEGEHLPDGKGLFPVYTTQVEFPSEDTTKDFDVPAAESK